MVRSTGIYETRVRASYEGESSMPRLIRSSTNFVIFLMLSSFSATQSAERSSEPIYASLAKLPAGQREKRIEEGARKEGKLNFVHTWRGKNARDHVKLFEKRYSFIKVDMGDLGSQDAAERFIAEESAGAI